MQETAQSIRERMQKIADQPRSLDERMKNMNDLYETTSYHPKVESAPPDLETEANS